MPINSFLYPAPSTPTFAYNVANSLRFEDGSSDTLSRTPSSSGNRKTWTWSGWIKRSELGRTQNFFSAGTNNQNYTRIQFNSDDTIYIAHVDSASTTTEKSTTQKFRDTSAWMHIVWHIDTTQSTASNREKLYINGAQVTEFSTNTIPAEDYQSTMNEDVAHYIGTQLGSYEKCSCYFAEVVFIDGQALTPTSFGEFDSDSPNIWKPINVSGLTFGTNGFYLEFKQSGTSQNSSGLGADTSGNDHHFAVSNLTAIDQTVDTCTNNFATMLPITKSTDATFSEGNLNVTYGTASTRRSAFGSIAVSSGKWYWETKITATSSTSVEINLGISSTYNPDLIGNALVSTNGYSVSFFPSNGSLYIGNTQDETSLGNVAVNDIIGHALDMDNGTLQFYKNGSALGSANDITTSGSNVGELYPLFTPAVSCSSGDQTFTASYNFGSPEFSISSGNADANGHGNFEYAVPSGYFSLCTKNLAEFGG